MLSTKSRYKIAVIAGILIAAFFLPTVGHIIFAGHKRSVALLFYSSLFVWAFLGILFLYGRLVERTDFLLWKGQRHNFWHYILSVTVLYIIIVFCGYLAVMPRFFGWHETNRVMKMMDGLLSQSLPLLVFSAVSAGITEEFVCRGYLMPRIQLLFNNNYAAVLLSALIFSANHYGYFSLYELIFTFLFGVIFAIYYVMYKNLTVLMITHALVDLVSFLVHRTHAIKLH